MDKLGVIMDWMYNTVKPPTRHGKCGFVLSDHH